MVKRPPSWDAQRLEGWLGYQMGQFIRAQPVGGWFKKGKNSMRNAAIPPTIVGILVHQEEHLKKKHVCSQRLRCAPCPNFEIWYPFLLMSSDMVLSDRITCWQRSRSCQGSSSVSSKLQPETWSFMFIHIMSLYPSFTKSRKYKSLSPRILIKEI